MIIDARSLSSNLTLETDVCIVGGGTAGLTLAYDLIGRDIRVLLLESGGLKADRPSSELNWGENLGLRYYALDAARARYFGGSTNRWHVAIGEHQLGARIRPLDNIDFEERDWVPHSGWPFAKFHLEPYYEQAQGICATAPSSYEPEDWFDQSRYCKLPLDPTRVQTILFKFSDKEAFLAKCGEAVKKDTNTKVLLYANATEIECDQAARQVEALQVRILGGHRLRIKAKLYVLALGGIETPRLLLASNKVMLCGIGNQHDLVGRYFMEHLHFWSGLFLPSGKELFQKTTMYSRIHRINGVPVIAKLALPEPLMRTEKLINHNVQLFARVFLRPQLYPYLIKDFSSQAVASLKLLWAEAVNHRWPEDAGVHLRHIVLGSGEIARKAARKVRIKAGEYLDRKRVPLFIFANMTEQVPNPESRVVLCRSQDSLGMPRAGLNWQVTRQDVVNAVRVQEIIGAELARAGLGRLILQLQAGDVPGDLHGGYHHMGTTRMHASPKKGVVDPDGRIHGFSNLYIAGPSIFPTGGHANPVLTIVALTLRLAEHIRSVFRG